MSLKLLRRLKRQGPDNTGPFADADLARILQGATDSRARAFGARGVPEALRIAELMAIEQSRKMGNMFGKLVYFTHFAAVF